METEPNQFSIEQQRDKVAALYEEISPVYDDQFEAQAEYQAPKMLQDLYAQYGIKDGQVLDVGCGTGKLRRYLGDTFSYRGIDIAKGMIEEAKKKGYEGFVGPVEDVIKTLPDKSVDHVTALSSLYFIRDFDQLVAEFERVAKRSVFVTLEQFTPEVVEMMRARGIRLFNHQASVISHPTEIIKNTFLWKRPYADDKIFGVVVFKVI